MTQMHAPDLLRNPVWRPEQLGQPIPDSRHAISVALPRWSDVVGYEEKTAQVMERVSTGYPRFVIHPFVQKLGREITGGRPGLPFPSLRAATMAADFVRRNADTEAEVIQQKNAFAVATGGTGTNALRSFWQHTGLIVSSRQAEALLTDRTCAIEGQGVRASLRSQLAAWYDCDDEDVFLAPTGMAAVLASLQAVLQRNPGRPTAQLGFPYVDTLKLQQKFGAGGILLSRLDTIESRLQSLLERERLAACFCEIPGNPLLGCVDLRRISPLARKYHVPLIADDVVATPLNVDLSSQADLIATSLTKFVVGTADAMGGALICNPRSPLYHELKTIVRANHEELLWAEDADVLEQQARGFPDRMRQHNANGLLIAERLRQHPAVQRVWYPKWEFSEAYDAVRRPDGGWGALITFLPQNAERRSPEIYDRLACSKGPSLGAVFTLACPFTLLAHYTELDWAESCGVSRYLIRLSIGLEDPEELWRRLEEALQTG